MRKAASVCTPQHSRQPDPARRPDIPETPEQSPIHELLTQARNAGVDAAYVHVPFCTNKCDYCDFYSLPAAESRHEAFVERLIAEIRAARACFPAPLNTIFIGGGTPTVLAPSRWRRLLDVIGRELIRGAPVEFTVEANPETVNADLLAVLVAGGVNRLSLGAQSFDPSLLRALGRRHDPETVRASLALGRAAGIDNLSLDLIYGIPGQGLDAWIDDLDAAIALEPAHVSCYALSYETGTLLTRRLEAGEVERAEEDLEADMYEAAIDRLGGAGFEHYEISNWARRDPNGQSWRCRHNMVYWMNGPWWAFGPAACGHVDGWRWKNRADLESYLASGPLPLIEDVEHLDLDGRIGEQLMLRLRLIDGMPLDELDDLLAPGSRAAPRVAAMDRAIEGGLLERTATHLRLTQRGLLLADTVLRELL